MKDSKTALRRERPLSPHLSSYRFQSNMALSILHRMTGIGLAIGLCLLVAWLYALADGPATYDGFIAVFRETLIGQILVVGWGLALCYHAANGLRHLVWDTGHGLELANLLRSNAVVLSLAGGLAILLFFA